MTGLILRISKESPRGANTMRTIPPSTTRRTHRSFRSGKVPRAGVTAVEFACVAPVFFMLILGLIELGRGIMVVHLLTNAARAGCRVGVLEGKGNSDVAAAVNQSLAGAGMSGDSVTITVNDGSGDVKNANPDDELTVVVSVPVSGVTWVPGGKYLSGNLTGQYTLRKE
jgi:Flp pilus assembly protein TadG